MEFSANMNILPEKYEDLYAIGAVTVDHLFVIQDVKVIYLQKKDQEQKELTICLPRHYNRKTETWESVVSLTKEQKKELDTAVVADLKEKMVCSMSTFDDCRITVRLCDRSFLPTLGYVDINYKDQLSIRKIRIMENANGDIQILFPTNRKKDGNYISLFGLSTLEYQIGLEDLVRERFHAEYREKNGKEYAPSTMMKPEQEEKTQEESGQEEMEQEKTGQIPEEPPPTAARKR